MQPFETQSATLPSKPADQAVVHYLGHSAWLIHTSRRILLLDYGELPARDAAAATSLEDGCLDLQSARPTWLGDTTWLAQTPGLDVPQESQPLFVVASHRHRDHYHAGLHRWLVERPDSANSAIFVLGLDEQDDNPVWAADSPRTCVVRPNEIRPLGPDGRLASIQSTDQGVALLIDFPEISLYFGGDLALWADEPFYHEQHAKSLVQLALLLEGDGVEAGEPARRPVDLAFIPVCTSDGYQEPALIDGALSTVRLLRPRHLFPMHGHTFEFLYDRFASILASRAPDFTGEAYIALRPGDRFAVQLHGGSQENPHVQ